jgi:hypothetical protein
MLKRLEIFNKYPNLKKYWWKYFGVVDNYLNKIGRNDSRIYKE